MKTSQDAPVDWRAESVFIANLDRFCYATDNQCHRDDGRNHGEPQHELDLPKPKHQHNCQQRAKYRPNGIHRLTQTKAGTADLRR